MHVNISPTWKPILQDELKKDYFKSLLTFVDKAYHDTTCYPAKKEIFKALSHTSFDDVCVVIIGQDPYHGFGQANGLCFSVGENIKHPPSLKNIFKEIENDLRIPIPVSGNLDRWAKQGVLLLNATLTVKEHAPGSHQKKGWEPFTDAIISGISEKRQGVIFLLWGGYAKKKGAKIDTTKHYVLTSGHPSPLSANRGYWFGNKHFSSVNSYLIAQGKKAISW
jgi:uracil-DNA glycosylase